MKRSKKKIMVTAKRDEEEYGDITQKLKHNINAPRISVYKLQSLNQSKIIGKNCLNL